MRKLRNFLAARSLLRLAWLVKTGRLRSAIRKLFLCIGLRAFFPLTPSRPPRDGSWVRFLLLNQCRFLVAFLKSNEQCGPRKVTLLFCGYPPQTSLSHRALFFFCQQTKTTSDSARCCLYCRPTNMHNRCLPRERKPILFLSTQCRSNLE